MNTVDNGMCVDKPKPFYIFNDSYTETCDICDNKPYDSINGIIHCKDCYKDALDIKFGGK